MGPSLSSSVRQPQFVSTRYATTTTMTYATSSQIQSLLSSPSTSASESKTIEFLDAEFSSVADLDGLEQFMKDAQEKNDELQAKLAQSKFELEALLASTRTNLNEDLDTAQNLALLRHSLTDELAELSKELVSSYAVRDVDEDGDGDRQEQKSTLLEDLESIHRNLKELYGVRGYVQVIEHALKLGESAVDQIRQSKSALTTRHLSGYQALNDFVEQVVKACAHAETMPDHPELAIVKFLKTVKQRTWGDMKGALISSLVEVAEKFGWPTPVKYHEASVEDRAKFEHLFKNLLRLQNLGEKVCAKEDISEGEEPGLYPIQALVQPIALRFQFHFSGSRQTNRLDKPEWFFTHVLNLVHDHRSFMEDVIQRLLEASECTNINAWREFTLLLIPMVDKKLRQIVPSLLDRPSLLAHTIYQCLIFDSALVEEGFSLDHTSMESKELEKWEGTSEVILGNEEWFDVWLQAEKQFADDQYHDIITGPDAWLVEEVSANVKATSSARRVKSLCEQITDRYSPLPHFGQRLSFLLNIQLPLLDSYLTRVTSSLDAFESLSSVLVRAVPGALGVNISSREDSSVKVDGRGLTHGTEGVQRLCKALLSAKYMEATMRGWSEDLFFVELWAETSRSSQLRERAEQTSFLPATRVSEGSPTNMIFDILQNRSEQAVERAETMIIHQVCGEVESALKAHFNRPSTSQTQVQSDVIGISETIFAPMAVMSSHLTFLRATVPVTTLTMLYRKIASRVAEHLLQRQIMFRGRLGQSEGKQIFAESELWIETCTAALGGALGGGRSRVEGPWRKFYQSACLVSAEGEAWDKIVDTTFGIQPDEVWEEDLVRLTGSAEMERFEAMEVLRRREDCSR